MQEITIWAIVITIVFNILANLLTTPLQKYLGSLSESRKKKNEERKRIFANTVRYLLNNPYEQIYLRVRFMEHTLLAFICLFFGYSLTISENGLLVIIGIVLFVIGNYGLIRTRNMGKLIVEIWKHRKANHPDIYLD